MPNTSMENGLFLVVEYIMNKAEYKELEVISAAIERKKQEISQTNGISAINPEEMAKKMSLSINRSIQSSLEGVRHTFRNFAADMLQKEAPELSSEQMEALIDSWIPKQGSYDSKEKSIAKDGKIGGIPADVLYGMIIQFVSYSIGEMSENENKELKNTMGNWTEKYWEHFPSQIRIKIKNFINGEITSGEFQKDIKTIIY